MDLDMQDLLVIERIEQILEIKLEKASGQHAFMNKYTLENGHVLRLSIGDKLSEKNFSQTIEAMKQLEHLTWLRIISRDISDASPLKELKQLSSLVLLNLPISEIGWLGNLKQLTKLTIDHSKTTDFSPINELSNLVSLELIDYQLSDISFIKELKNLSVLHLNNTRISDISPLSELTGLTVLSLNNNQIPDISPLSELKQLVRLNMVSSLVTDISPLSELRQLTYVNLNNNLISDISPVGGLKELTSLSLNDNKISDISPVCELKHLKELYLINNRISSLPSALVGSINFIDIIVDENIFSNTGVYLSGNPLEDPPLEIIKQGREALLRYYERKETQAFSEIKEAKLIIVGDGAAGKTSLIKRLEDPGAELPKADERTRGIDVTNWEFEKNFTAHIWDFGGQDVYYPVHRFFITENAVFALLATTRVEQHNFEYWIPTIYQFGGNSPILIGQTCHDGIRASWNELGIYIGNPLFNIIKNGARDFFPINLIANNTGLDEIKREIIHQIKTLPHCNKSIPTSWIKVREELKNQNLFCINYSGFRDICKTVDSRSFRTDEDFYDCCRFLHDIGSIFWYHKNEMLKEWVVLRPEWAVEAVYKIIDDEEIKSRLGYIYPNDFKRLWLGGHFSDHHHVLKEMLREFKIAFPKKHDKGSFILPALLESMPKEKDWNEGPHITIEYEYTFMPRAIVNQLSAELSEYILMDETGSRKENVWNNAVVLMYEDVTKCLVKEDFYNRRITIRASGRDARGLAMIVMRSLNNIEKAYKGVAHETLIPCICDECRIGNNVTKYRYNDLIRRYDEKGREVAHCDESGQAISIDELIYNAGLRFRLKEPGTKPMKINVFLASSKELYVERQELEILINRQNKKLVDEGKFISLEIWEDSINAMSQTRLQDEYNKKVRESDVFISLFFTKAGKYTVEEFETAHEQFLATGKPYVYTYFRNSPVNIGDIDEKALRSLLKFKKRLLDLGHFVTEYKDITDLKYQFRDQLDKLIVSGGRFC